MQKTITTLLFSLFTICGFSQTNDADIKEIQEYIQTTSQSEWFDPVNKNGTLANNSTYDLAYYILPTNEVFSIIYTVFDKNTLSKVFYYQNNELIACIIEETDPNNANKLLRFADYFYKAGVLIQTNEEKIDFPSNEAYQKGMEKLKEVKQSQKI
ncbi:MAG TPA: hypothetical protein VLY87_01575 [Flavobacterium sp.]|nr:hypothetical protein [Flavobacterium sp.]